MCKRVYWYCAVRVVPEMRDERRTWKKNSMSSNSKSGQLSQKDCFNCVGQLTIEKWNSKHSWVLFLFARKRPWSWVLSKNGKISRIHEPNTQSACECECCGPRCWMVKEMLQLPVEAVTTWTKVKKTNEWIASSVQRNGRRWTGVLDWIRIFAPPNKKLWLPT